MTYPPNTAIRRAIYGRLAVDAVLKGTAYLGGTLTTGYKRSIYYQTAPEDAVFPFAIFSKSSGLDTGPMNTFGGTLHQNDIWAVKVVDHSTTADRAEASANRIRELLTDYTTDAVSGGTIAYLARESDFDYAEVVDGELYFHVGSNYRVVTHFPGTALS